MRRRVRGAETPSRRRRPLELTRDAASPQPEPQASATVPADTFPGEPEPVPRTAEPRGDASGFDVQALTEALSHPVAEVRVQALTALLNRPSSAALAAVAARLTDPQPRVRALAVSVLAAIKEAQQAAPGSDDRP
jgi:hypothetical protein